MSLLLNKSRWCCNKMFTEVYVAFGEFLFMVVSFPLNVTFGLWNVLVLK